MRGGKGELWEGGIRVPFIISWKGQAAAGRVVDAPVTSMDATATALDLAGMQLDEKRLDGASLLPLLAGKSDNAPHETLFWRVGRQNALRHGHWKLIRGQGNPPGNSSIFPPTSANRPTWPQNSPTASRS